MAISQPDGACYIAPSLEWSSRLPYGAKDRLELALIRTLMARDLNEWQFMWNPPPLMALQRAVDDPDVAMMAAILLRKLDDGCAEEVAHMAGDHRRGQAAMAPSTRRTEQDSAMVGEVNRQMGPWLQWKAADLGGVKIGETPFN